MSGQLDYSAISEVQLRTALERTQRKWKLASVLPSGMWSWAAIALRSAFKGKEKGCGVQLGWCGPLGAGVGESPMDFPERGEHGQHLNRTF